MGYSGHDLIYKATDIPSKIFEKTDPGIYGKRKINFKCSWECVEGKQCRGPPQPPGFILKSVGVLFPNGKNIYLQIGVNIIQYD